MRRFYFLLTFAASIPFQRTAAQTGDQPANDALLNDSVWNFHFQFTGIDQGHPSFKSPYSGRNSVQAVGEKAYSVTATLDIGHSLWKGAALYFGPEMAGGAGISRTLGIAGFPNGETFRIGDPQATVYVARIFLHQDISLDKAHHEHINDDAHQVGTTVSTTRIGLSLGKFTLGDYFDDNNVSHDPREDFMNWALMNNGAYDYAANTRGYTYAFVAEYIRPGWTVRFGTALEPVEANGPALNWNYFKTNSSNLELEHRYSIHDRKGTVRLLGYYNINAAPYYRDVINAKLNGSDTSLDVVDPKKYGSPKPGLGLNADQALTRSLFAFTRLGWNNGKTASWAFAEIDNTISGGLRLYGNSWHRPTDNLGVAAVSNGISRDHRDFLAIGGYGFMLGDGRLPHYGREDIAEVFYEVKLFPNFWLTGDYQFVYHPAYNKDRGPVNLFALKGHIAL